MKVVAIDPGGFTGIATYSAQVMPDDTHQGIEWQTFFLGPEEHHKEFAWLLEQLISDQDTHIVYEAFNYRQDQRTGLVLISREYIGIVKYMASEYARQVTLESQEPSILSHRQVQDEKLATLGLLRTPVSTKPNKDMNDASRHLVYYLAINKKGPQLRHILEALRPR